MDLKKFAERLCELMFEAKLNAPAFAKEIGCGRNTINRYLNGENMPTTKMLIRMADYFKCTTDFILGLEQESYAKNFKECPPFCERLNFVCGHFGKTKYELQKISGIPESAIYNWQRGQTSPTVESLIKMSAFFGCSVDFILGREI